MIHKIDKLVSIGKFRNYQAVGDVSFKKLTLVYADNGSGKTTLSSVFRSLGENDPDRITKRITTDSTFPQSAIITQRPVSGANITHTFGNNGWRVSYPNIEVFDAHFVDENVYSGCEFNDDHKKQLHQFVIGAQSVVIQQQLDQNKVNKAALKVSLATLETQLIDDVGNGLMPSILTGFINIKPANATNIDQRIVDGSAAFSSANANSVIQTLSVLQVQSPISFSVDLDNLRTDLTTTPQTLQDRALSELFNLHSLDLSSHGIITPQAWLKIGFQYVESTHINGQHSNCPFCTQAMPNTLEIIKAYTELFNEEFNALVTRLNSYITALKAINIELHVQRISATSILNATRVASWEKHLPATIVTPIAEILTDDVALKQALDELVEIVNQKVMNPSQIGDLTPVDGFSALVDSINLCIITHNTNVTSYNQAISTFRTGIQTVTQAENNLKDLIRTKKRFEPTVISLCTQLLAGRQNLKNLEANYTQLSTQQQTVAQSFFATYKDRINYYLNQVFRTSFAIADVERIAPQGKATQSKINYKLTMDGHEISFDVAQQHNVKDCLSEGDKSTIALAFFLSKLDIDPGKADKILIFDDPLSSFDSNRRMYTVQLIKGLLEELKQVVVLSHNEYFLHEISKSVALANKKILHINKNYLTNSAFLEEFNLGLYVENSYFKHVKKLESFLMCPDLLKKDEILGGLRNVLEAHIRFKFYRQLIGIPANDQTFGRVITCLANSGVNFRDNRRQHILDKLNLINVISCKPHHGEPEPDLVMIGVDPATMNISELCGFVNDTIDLIDNQL